MPRRPKAPQGPARAAAPQGLDGQTCLKCTRPATSWQLAYFCDAHQPPADRGVNCKHTATIEMRGRGAQPDVVVCSWCGSIVKHNP